MSGAKRGESLAKGELASWSNHGTAFDWSIADFQDHDEDGVDDKTDAGWNVIASMRGAHRSTSAKGVGGDLAALVEDSEEAVRREIMTRGEKAFKKDIGEMHDMDDEADKAMQEAGQGVHRHVVSLGAKKRSGKHTTFSGKSKNPFDGSGGQHGTAGRAHGRDKVGDDGGGKPKLMMMPGGKKMLNTETGAMTNVSTDLTRLRRSQFSCDLDSLLPTLDAPLGSCPIPAGSTDKGGGGGGGKDRGPSPGQLGECSNSDFSFENQRPPCADCAHRDFCICPAKLPASSQRLKHPIILYNDVGEPTGEFSGGVEGGASAGRGGGEPPEWQSRVQKVHSRETKVHARFKCPNVQMSMPFTCSIHSQSAKDGKNENPGVK
jgi:hypothetical protein